MVGNPLDGRRPTLSGATGAPESSVRFASTKSRSRRWPRTALAAARRAVGSGRVSWTPTPASPEHAQAGDVIARQPASPIKQSPVSPHTNFPLFL